MSTAIRKYPHVIQHKRFARNGLIPEAPFARRIAIAQNHAMAFRRKTFLCASALDGRFNGTSGTTVLYRAYGHTGHGATHLGVVVGIGLDTVSSGSAPQVEIKATMGGGATDTLTLSAGNFTGTPTDSPSEIVWRDGLVAVTANDTVEIRVAAMDYARILSILVYEIASDVIDSSVDYYVEGSPTIGDPVYRGLVERTTEGLSKMWRHNGGHLLTWPGPGASTMPPYGTTTWTNVIDAATSVTANTAGFYLGDGDQTLEGWCRKKNPGDLEVVLAAYCSVTGSATGEVRLQNSGGTVASITGMGTGEAWYTTTATLSGLGSIDKCDLQARTSNGANTMTLHAVSMYCYLA